MDGPVTNLDIKEAVSWLATVCTIGLYLTGIPICQKIITQGNTEDVSIVPFLTFFVNATLWCKYGTLIHDQTIILVNTCALIFQFVYLFIYYTYTSQKGLVQKQVAGACIFVFPILLYLRFLVSDITSAIEALGTICCILSVIAYASPLATVSEVVKKRSTDSMSFPLCFANLVVALQWTMYGYLLHDLHVEIPNIFGCILGAIQVGLFVKYPTRAKQAARIFVT